MKPRKGRVKLDGRLVGTIEELDGTTRFTYAPAWLKRAGPPISVTLPLRPAPYEWPGLHPFFENLLPEGWYLEIVSRKLKIPKEDAFGLLLGTCGDCVGAVEVEPIEEGRS